MLIEIVGTNQTFFRRITKKHWKAMVASVPTCGWSLANLDRLHDLVWGWSKPAKISSTGDVEATVVDDMNDIDSSQQSWEENHEALVDECEHEATMDRNGHLCCQECGGVDV